MCARPLPCGRVTLDHSKVQEHLRRLEAQRAADAFRDRDPRCPTCGYDLRGLQQLRCPECGARIRTDRYPPPRPSDFAAGFLSLLTNPPRPEVALGIVFATACLLVGHRRGLGAWSLHRTPTAAVLIPAAFQLLVFPAAIVLTFIWLDREMRREQGRLDPRRSPAPLLTRSAWLLAILNTALLAWRLLAR